MSEIRVVVKPFEMISIIEYMGIQQINEHGYVKLSGLIQENSKNEYIQKALEETWVHILQYDDNTEKVLFCGILMEFNIQTEGNSSIIELLINTGTRLMDYKSHIRSFQEVGYTYKQIADLCNKGYEHTGMIMTEGGDSLVESFIMQYEETDWAFLKRVASSLNTVLVPSYITEGEKYFFGIPRKKAEFDIETHNYAIRQEPMEYTSKKADMEINKWDAVSYIVESRGILKLGDQIKFNGKNLYVWRIESSLNGNELIHKYYLKTKNGIRIPKFYHDKIIGLSLLGKVSAVQGEQVQVKLRDDENIQSGVRWFLFSTIYSSPDGTGWYCMPEIGDTIRLYFPTEDETEAYVASAVHENQGNGVRTNPDNKIWRNKEGKEIRMTPDSIRITNNKGMSVELSDQRGININSNKSININADKGIRISSSEAGLELAASNRILLKQGETTMELANGIQLSGAKVNLQ